MLGIEKLAFFAKRLGLGARTGIDLPGEDPGLIPSPEWARRMFKRPWWAGETISVAIGQGAVATTPLQLAYTLGGITSGGVFRRPHVAFNNQLLPVTLEPAEDSIREFPLSDNTVDAVCKGMWGVVNEGGTGASAYEPGLDMAGKTGTAQVVSTELQQSAGKHEYRNNAWFVGYSPSSKPEIVVSALVMQGDHSTVAVPIVASKGLEPSDGHRGSNRAEGRALRQGTNQKQCENLSDSVIPIGPSWRSRSSLQPLESQRFRARLPTRSWLASPKDSFIGF
jgi:penicillin-binding protein 2